MNKNWINSKLKILYLNFFIKNCYLLIPRPPLRMSKLQEKPSALKREHPALQTMKFPDLFYIFVGHLFPPGSGSGSESTAFEYTQKVVHVSLLKAIRVFSISSGTNVICPGTCGLGSTGRKRYM
jgi:hypothetical protein